MKKVIFKITDLNLWDENPRFPEEYFNKSESELIEYLFNKKGEKEKIIELAKSIIENFDIVPWEKLIVWDSGRKKITLEGNRRLMVYKLLLNPNLISDSKIKKIFSEGQAKTKITNDFSVECLVTNDKEHGLRYVELKHLEKGYKGWGESERNNFRRRRGRKNEEVIIKTEIDKRVKDLNIPQDIKDKILGHGYVTTFYRVTTTSPAKDFFGYEINGEQLEIKDPKFDKKLKVIIWNLLNKKAYKELFDELKNGEKDKLNSRTLNKSENIIKYLQSITDEDIKRAEKEISSSIKETINIFGEKTKEIQLTEKPLRKTPITKQKDLIFGRKLQLQEGKVNTLYSGIDDIYEKFKHNETQLNKVLPILGMSLRLILDVASREILGIDKDSAYKEFLDKAKREMKMSKVDKNFLSLTNTWIDGSENMEGILAKYAHGNIPVDKGNILNLSKIVGDILEFYFGKNKK